MNKLSILLILLTSCSTTPKAVVRNYRCTAFNAHGSYVHAKVEATSEDQAVQTLEVVVKRLVDKGVLPDCAVTCELDH